MANRVHTSTGGYGWCVAVKIVPNNSLLFCPTVVQQLVRKLIDTACRLLSLSTYAESRRGCKWTSLRISTPTILNRFRRAMFQFSPITKSRKVHFALPLKHLFPMTTGGNCYAMHFTSLCGDATYRDPSICCFTQSEEKLQSSWTDYDIFVSLSLVCKNRYSGTGP